MILNAKIDGWLNKLLLHPEDTPDTIDQKVYLVGNMIIPTITLSILLVLLLLFNKIQLVLLIMPVVLIMIVPAALLFIIKRYNRYAFTLNFLLYSFFYLGKSTFN